MSFKLLYQQTSIAVYYENKGFLDGTEDFTCIIMTQTTNAHVTTYTYVANISFLWVVSGWSHKTILLIPVYVVRMYTCIILFHKFRDGT